MLQRPEYQEYLAWGREPAVSASEVRVLVALMEWAGTGNGWCCYPSIRQIMSRTGLQRTAVYEARKALVGRGAIVRKQVRIRSGRWVEGYQLVPFRPVL